MESDKSLEPIVIPNTPDQKKPRYKKSRKGVGGRKPSEELKKFFENPLLINFIIYLIKNNASDNEISRQINKPLSTFQRWKSKNPHLWVDALQNSESEVERIRKSMLKTAEGFWVERPVYDKKGNIIDIKMQYYPPNFSAQQYVLNNRDPANWKAKVEHNHAIEELPFEINFVRASDQNKALEDKPDIKATETFEPIDIKLIGNEKE